MKHEHVRALTGTTGINPIIETQFDDRPTEAWQGQARVSMQNR